MNTQFREMLMRDNFVVLDTETTGLERPAEICQIAIIDPRGFAICEGLIKPTLPIPPAATAVHGITDRMVEDCPTWAEYVPAIQDALSGRDVIVYNALYDRKLFHWSDELAGLPHIEWKEIATWHCAMLAYAEYHGERHEYYGSFVWQNLVAALRQQGLPVDENGEHSALGDALMTLRLVKHVTRDLSIWDAHLLSSETDS